jgi:hypothetical protein
VRRRRVPGSADRGAEAVPVIDECVRLAAGKTGVDPRMLPLLFKMRRQHFGRAKDAAGCQQTAEMWERLKRTDNNSLCQAACNRAVTAATLLAGDKSASAAKKADAEADRAMAWLKQAVEAGFEDVERMKKDHDLNCLRTREDFKKLLSDISAKKASGKSKP